jgi:spore coat protein U-like protein
MKISPSFRHPGLVLAVVCLGVGSPAQAVTSKGQQTVRAQVNPTCTIVLGTAMAFGTLSTTPARAVSKADATGSITISCTSGTSYSVVAGDGNNYDTGWRMVNGSSQYLNYGLYWEPTLSYAFPRSGTTVAGTGNGSAKTVNVYGRVPAQTAGGIGNFTDAVTFTLAY